MSSQQDRLKRCARCAQIKQACDGLSPCTRCSRLSVPCVPKASAIDAQDLLSDQPKTKARIRRAHSGCNTCKKRRKKCDEGKPKCGDCRRLCLPCDWTTGLKRITKSGSNQALASSWIEAAEDLQEAEQVTTAALSPIVPLQEAVP